MALFGIKEVADVTFYDVSGASMNTDTGVVTGSKKFTLDSLKVSNIEMTAEQAEARGGKGNPALIVWDYGKEINLTLEDAVFTDESLGALLGTTATGKTFEITPNTFPGYYAVSGTTYARQDEDGKDYVFTFFIPKAKLMPETTFTMEADGDPSVFNFNLKVLRNGSNTEPMIQFFKDTSAVK